MDVRMNTDAEEPTAGKNRSIIHLTIEYMLVAKEMLATKPTVHITIMNQIRDNLWASNLELFQEIEEVLGKQLFRLQFASNLQAFS